MNDVNDYRKMAADCVDIANRTSLHRDRERLCRWLSTGCASRPTRTRDALLVWAAQARNSTTTVAAQP